MTAKHTSIYIIYWKEKKKKKEKECDYQHSTGGISFQNQPELQIKKEKRSKE